MKSKVNFSHPLGLTVKEGFNDLVAEYRAELKVTVTSATPLTKDVLSRLELALKRSQTAKATKVLTITNKVCLSYTARLVDA